MKPESRESTRMLADMCHEHVRQHDPDRYLCTMFAPEPVRGNLMALYAFNVELALVRDRVSEELLGEMRFQWWREQIEAAYGGAARPEGYAGALHDFITKCNPPQEMFVRLIDARTRDLSHDLFEDMSELEGYCRGITQPLLQLTLHSLATETSSILPDETLLEDIAIAWALTTLIRAVPAHAAHGRCLIPRTFLQEQDTTREAVYSEVARQQRNAIIKQLATEAERRLASARQQAHSVSKDLFPALLPITLSGFYLSTIRKSGYDPFHARIMMPNRAKRVLRLLYATWRKRC